MKMLYLTLMKRWFDMIDFDIKKEEYREIKDYWFRRFYGYSLVNAYGPDDNDIYSTVTHNLDLIGQPTKRFDVVKFRNGYGKNAPVISFKCLGITIDEGREEWGAEPGKKYFKIKLGDRI